jgi:hypothetical protein
MLGFEARLSKSTVDPIQTAHVRPELDMLVLRISPPSRGVKAALTSMDDPWKRIALKVFQSLVHSMNSKGEYDGTLRSQNVRATAKPIVEHAPAAI